MISNLFINVILEIENNLSKPHFVILQIIWNKKKKCISSLTETLTDPSLVGCEDLAVFAAVHRHLC